jgi:DNA repair exonuclease SbcCD ATPase subunit
LILFDKALEDMTPECPSCAQLHEKNAELLERLDALQSELEPLRMEVQCLQKTRAAQTRWAGDAPAAIVALQEALKQAAGT